MFTCGSEALPGPKGRTFLTLSAAMNGRSSTSPTNPGAPSFPRSVREGGDFDLPNWSDKVKIPALSRQKQARQGWGTLIRSVIWSGADRETIRVVEKPAGELKAGAAVGDLANREGHDFKSCQFASPRDLGFSR